VLGQHDFARTFACHKAAIGVTSRFHSFTLKKAKKGRKLVKWPDCDSYLEVAPLGLLFGNG
jgi:hypothetical protein